MKNTEYKNMLEFLERADKIAITMHIRPDGDSVGSSCALRLALLAMGKEKVDIWAEGSVSEQFNYIQGADGILDSEVFESGAELATRYDLLVVVDTGDVSRIGKTAHILPWVDKVLVFDHHLEPTMKCDLMVTNPTRSSTGEMLFEFFIAHNINITKDMATALYTAVSSDTGCFLFTNTTWYTHYVAMELMKLDIDIDNINYVNFREYNPKILSGFVRLLKKLRFIHDGSIAITFISHRMVKKYKFTHDERHRFQRYATDASGVRVSIFITEQDSGEFNVSLRSHGGIDVSAVARHFGGGGHRNAAGLTICGRYKNVINDIVGQVKKVL